MRAGVFLLSVLLATVRASLLTGLEHSDQDHHHDEHSHHHDEHAHHSDDNAPHHGNHAHNEHVLQHDHAHTHDASNHTHTQDAGKHAHSHDTHVHNGHVHPLATGKEAIEASVRINELFSAFFQEDQQLPQDMPAMKEVPLQVEFSCVNRLPGYYADVDHDCQVYHVCRDDHPVASFLCPNGTVFNQGIFACDWWFTVDCSLAPSFYHLNDQLYKEEEEEEEEPIVKQEDAVSRAKSTFQEEFVGQAHSILQTKEPVPDFLAVLQGLSVPDETPEGSDTVEALAFPRTPQFIIPVPPSAQGSQKKLNHLATDYLPPVEEYLPPTNEYLPPRNEYLPPTNEYLPPAKEYLPPLI